MSLSKTRSNDSHLAASHLAERGEAARLHLILSGTDSVLGTGSYTR
jgi:hypothetical protein